MQRQKWPWHNKILQAQWQIPNSNLRTSHWIHLNLPLLQLLLVELRKSLMVNSYKRLKPTWRSAWRTTSSQLIWVTPSSKTMEPRWLLQLHPSATNCKSYDYNSVVSLMMEQLSCSMSSECWTNCKWLILVSIQLQKRRWMRWPTCSILTRT